MVQKLAEGLFISIIILLSIASTAVAIPIDLTKEEKEKLDVALDKCMKGVENQFGVKFFYFLNYEARTEKEALLVYADIMASTSKTATPSPKRDENTQYFRCTAKLSADKWEVEFKPIIIKTKEKGVFEPPTLNGYINSRHRQTPTWMAIIPMKPLLENGSTRRGKSF